MSMTTVTGRTSTVWLGSAATCWRLTLDVWDWPNIKQIQESGTQSGNLKSITPKFLYQLIVESQTFGGEVLRHFWHQLGSCDPKLNVSIKRLEKEDFESGEASLKVLFRELDLKDVDFQPTMSDMAAQFFIHLGVAFMNPGGQKSRPDTVSSVSEYILEETEKLLEIAKETGSFKRPRKQVALKILAFRRDGIICPLTGIKFAPFEPHGMCPALAHIIPHAIQGKGKSGTMRCISMFAGIDVTEVIEKYMNDICNVMNMPQDAHVHYNHLMWGIEAKEEGGKVKYFFRTVPTVAIVRMGGFAVIEEGHELHFGQGPESELLKNGPLADLCNLQLAVARVMRMSGAADIVMEWKDQADDEGLPRLFIDSEEFCEMLEARLLLPTPTVSGRGLIAGRHVFGPQQMDLQNF